MSLFGASPQGLVHRSEPGCTLHLINPNRLQYPGRTSECL